jgi:succinyl-CoA synthetase alpha subunit
MAIFGNKDTAVIVQGITGREGRFQTKLMLEYGTKVVGGVRAGKGGEWVDGVPVFDTVKGAVDATGANTSIIYVPGPGAADAMYEAVDAGIKLTVCISDPVPIMDMMKVSAYLKQHPESRLIGPNCPGFLTPSYRVKIGIIPGYVATPGTVGVVSKSGTLTYEVIYALTQAGMGQSTCIGIGGDPVPGTNFIEVLEMFEHDPETEKIVLIGEIGGRAEIDAAQYIKSKMTKPVAAFIAGRSAPPGTRMGHAGAIVEGGEGSAEDKMNALREAGVRVADNPEQIPELLR